MTETMNYMSFKNYLCDHIHAFLPDHYRGGRVEVSIIHKTNDLALDALSIEEPGVLLTPAIYLEDFYADYAAGCPLDEILAEIARRRILYTAPSAGPDPLMRRTDLLMRFDKVRDRIIPRLINYGSNRAYLEDKPFKLIEDLAVTYHILASCDGQDYCTAVTREMLRGYHSGVERLHTLALENYDRLQPPWFRELDTVVTETIEARGDLETLDELELRRGPDGRVLHDGTMVVSSATRCYGAAAMLIPSLMDRMGRLIGKEFYIIPSSVHEVILRPRSCVGDVQALRMMVREINHSIVDRSERLSDNIYTYDFENHLPVICREK